MKITRGMFLRSVIYGPLYVNSWVGYWRLPIRLFCRPEVALIEI